jgi:hypothetical protein
MEFTLDRPEVFPSGTVIGVYDAAAILNTAKPPTTSAIQTKEGVEGATAVTFTGLTEAHAYYAGAEVGKKWRYARFVPGKMGQSLKPPQRYPEHSPG